MPTQTAIVFAGGGSLGAVQVGMLRALVEAEVQFDMVVGASVGAINGAYFAARPNAQGVETLAEFWRGLSRTESMRQLVSDIEHFRTLTSLHIVPPLCPVDVSVFNFDQTESLLERAYEQTLRWLDHGGLERTKVPGALTVHSHAHEH
ncbi:patatin-like phospholipase family protein [Pseudomonas sp. S1(2024)]|uniref:patatin-like phospholipase family protein n=1 Tax=Pseudomonas sp. S1(2024) TaxID=3390191 RepID=UPI003979A1BC